jgi:hypothetical protein
MNKINKVYKPKMYIPAPLEFIIQLFVWVIVSLPIIYLMDYHIYEYHSIDFISFLKFIFGTRFYTILLLLVLFCTYKICNTFSAVSMLVIDYENHSIKISYWFLWFLKKNINIKFDELSFFVREGVFILSGYAIGIHIYKSNNYCIKFVTKNGWKEYQIDEIVKNFLQITNSKMRKKNNLTEKRMLGSLKDDNSSYVPF